MDEDLLLGMLVWRVESSDFRTDITLTIGGIVLMGDMISEQDFCEGVAATIPAEQTEDREYFRNLPALFDEVIERSVLGGQDPAETTLEEFRQSFVHLTNIRIFEQGEYHGFRQTFWRGKVAAVDGFWIGTPTSDQ
jgi:hypothetical protein